MKQRRRRFLLPSSDLFSRFPGTVRCSFRASLLMSVHLCFFPPIACACVCELRHGHRRQRFMWTASLPFCLVNSAPSSTMTSPVLCRERQPGRLSRRTRGLRGKGKTPASHEKLERASLPFESRPTVRFCERPRTFILLRSYRNLERPLDSSLFLFLFLFEE